ncbi:Uncharacterized protein FWK35_00030020 [Aphis craccivora]|uniref:Uncharacterized protein n=1 Tax=Aphis craccivora TaxID=307492 RepID=A0A6G0VIE2_APHCR|nr:Uncharacterized protein FWK35_00030020 [Aphis craccivora]
MSVLSTYIFKSVGKNPKKMREKRDFLRKTSFRQNRIFYFAITQKRIDRSPYTVKFSKQLKISIFLIRIYTKYVKIVKIVKYYKVTIIDK